MEKSFFDWIQWILQDSGLSLLDGIWKTMVIAVVATFFGCIIGFVVGILQTVPVNREERPLHWFGWKCVRGVLTAYVEVFRGTPMMVQAAFIFYGAALLFDWHMDMWAASIFIVSINTGAYMAETVRGGILSIDPGQIEGAQALGMTHVQTMVHVILPQAFVNILPQIGNNLIINIKDTCVLTIIGVTELFYTVKSVAGATYAFFPAFTIAMVAYFILTFVCSRLLRLLERRMLGPEDYELTLADALVPGEGMPHFRERPKRTNRDLLAYEEEDRSYEAPRLGHEQKGGHDHD